MYIHVIIVAPEKILTSADIPWRREWRHSANSTPLICSQLNNKTRVYAVVTDFRLHHTFFSEFNNIYYSIIKTIKTEKRQKQNKIL